MNSIRVGPDFMQASKVSEARKSFTAYEDLPGPSIHPVPVAPRVPQPRPRAWTAFEALREFKTFPLCPICGYAQFGNPHRPFE